MKYYIFSLFLTIFLHENSCKRNGSYRTEDPRRICNEDYFRKNYEAKRRYFSLDALNKTCYAQYKDKCAGQLGETIYSPVEGTKPGDKVKQYSLYLVTKNLLFTGHNAGCWGVVLFYTTTEQNEADRETKVLYEQFKKTGGDADWLIKYKLKTTYNVTIALLPVGKQYPIQWTSPDRCELEIMHEISKRLEEKRVSYCDEGKQIPSSRRLKFASKICTEYKGRDEERRDVIRNGLHVKESCVLTIESKPKKLPTNVIIFSVMSVFVAFILFYSFVRWMRRRKNKKPAESTLIEETWVETSLSEHRSSIMVLNRPGCELLEIFLRDFAFILKSYGIDVKLALLEQNQVDAEGGIASYMQHHIDACDYILIMFTDDGKDTSPLFKHKPYEFALKVMGGLAYHQNDGSRYIPMYLTSYQDIVKHLPSFLNASSTFGYRLPKDIDKLLKRILRVDQLQTTKERSAKDMFFVNRMKEQSKKILEKRHPHCLKENCTKGTAFASIVNLSSIWPSTVHSKWQSASHLDDEKDSKNEILAEPCENSQQNLLHYKITTMLEGHSGNTHEHSDMTNDRGEDNEPDTETETFLSYRLASTTSDDIVCLTQLNK